MRDADTHDELTPYIGERYVDVLAERAIATLDDNQPEPRRKRYKRVAGSGLQRRAERARGPHDEN